MAQTKRIFTLCFALLIVISLAVPAYADVKSLNTDKPLYKKNTDTTMIFTGTADEEDISKIVTIVIYDPGNNFIKPAHSGIVSFEKTFEIKISEKDFSKFSSHGIYNATAFMIDQQKTDGVSITFDFSLDGSPVYHPTTQPAPTPQPTPTPTPSPTPTTQETQDDSEKSIEEKIQERIEAAKKQGSQTTSTSDSEKSIEEKIQERIEAAKKQESQTSPPEKTDSTGGAPQTGDTSDETTNEEKTDTTGVNIPVSFDSNVLYVAIGLGSAAAVVGAVYGMKHKPRFMASRVSEDTAVEQIQHSDAQTTHEEDYALMILKNRLAKGEITIDEYNELKRALTES